jgi:tRNA-dihydrouridine synthase
MKPDFWPELPRPFFCLAPMEDVTDTVFREIVLQESAPGCLHVLFTEFTSTDGLCHPKARARVAQRLRVNESERRLLRERGTKIVAQIWGNNPEKYRQAVRLIRDEMDFDGIDVNMGCPVKEVVRRGSCAALIGDPERAKEIVLATQEEADVPVSVKTRTGLNEHVTESWISHLLDVAPAAIILHGRTQKAQSKLPADWDEIAKAVRLRDARGSTTVIAGNGDVTSLADARVKAAASGVAGVMAGRGIFRDPWFFRDQPPEATRAERLDLLWRHTRLFAETWGDTKHFPILKKFYRIYASGFPDASELRVRLMAASNPADVRAALDV